MRYQASIALGCLVLTSAVGVVASENLDRCDAAFRMTEPDGTPFSLAVGAALSADGTWHLAHEPSDSEGHVLVRDLSVGERYLAIGRYADNFFVAEPRVFTCSSEQPIELVFERPSEQPLVALIAQPEKFIDRVVRVVGYLRYDKQSTVITNSTGTRRQHLALLYVDANSREHRIDQNAVFLLFTHPHQETAIRKLNGQIVAVYGRGQPRGWWGGTESNWGGRLQVIESERHRKESGW